MSRNISGQLVGGPVLRNEYSAGTTMTNILPVFSLEEMVA